YFTGSNVQTCRIVANLCQPFVKSDLRLFPLPFRHNITSPVLGCASGRGRICRNLLNGRRFANTTDSNASLRNQTHDRVSHTSEGTVLASRSTPPFNTRFQTNDVSHRATSGPSQLRSFPETRPISSLGLTNSQGGDYTCNVRALFSPP